MVVEGVTVCVAGAATWVATTAVLADVVNETEGVADAKAFVLVVRGVACRGSLSNEVEIWSRPSHKTKPTPIAMAQNRIERNIGMPCWGNRGGKAKQFNPASSLSRTGDQVKKVRKSVIFLTSNEIRSSFLTQIYAAPYRQMNSVIEATISWLRFVLRLSRTARPRNLVANASSKRVG